MAYLSVREQDEHMRRLFPAFKLVFDCGWYAYWEGPLTPICQTYQVRIRYITRRFFDNCYLTNSYENVTILDPAIGPDPRGTGEPPQHVYRLGYLKAYPRLCVHDPLQDEWTPAESIAEVLIPMIIKWLIFHEDWVDTGVWRGGGRHPEPLPMEDKWQKADLNPEDRARRERSLNAAFHKLGQRIGVFGSYLSMAEGYGAYFLPPFLPSLNGVTAMADASESTSILSLAPPREAFLRLGSALDSQLRNSETSTSNAETKSFPNASAQSLAA